MADFNLATDSGVIKIQDWKSELSQVDLRGEIKTKIIGTGIVPYGNIGTIQMLRANALILKAWADGEMPIECRIFYLIDDFTQFGNYIKIGLIQE
jgi:hypothetical protein